jgi:hypothetical protein
LMRILQPSNYNRQYFWSMPADLRTVNR